MKANNSTIEPSRRRARRRARRSIGVAVAGLLTLTACSSNPGPKRVAIDIIETEAIANPALDEECLLAELDEFSDDQLIEIAKNLDKPDSAVRSAGEEALADFKAALESCTASS